jgi:cobaltochelatase CobS
MTDNNSNEAQIDKLKNIIATSSDPTAKATAEKMLQRLEAQGGVAVMAQQQGVGLDPNAQAVLDALSIAMSKGLSKASDIRQEIEDILKIRKISEQDLSDSLRALITSSRKLELTIHQISGTISKTTTQETFLKLELTQKLLSDLRARNNSYLYGGAGTGKTYSAEEIASMLNWELITINCSQYTSPLDILGGQTIEGYQEGRLSQAWANVVVDSDGRSRKVDGVVLLLDELPKIDPNTAGLLNDALAKVKPNKFEIATNGAIIPLMPKIRNGRGQELTLGNLYVIGTGNVPLNTIDPDYEANFKQDLSLQDRFIGSCYKVKVPFEYELNNIMKGYAFIWIFLSKIRLQIAELKASSQAFVSLRIMINAKETYRTYRDVLDDMKNNNVDLVTNPKTIVDTMESFFDLFKPAIRENIVNAVDFDGFKKIVKEKDKMPWTNSRNQDPNRKPNDFDTASELKEAVGLIKDLEAKI